MRAKIKQGKFMENVENVKIDFLPKNTDELNEFNFVIDVIKKGYSIEEIENTLSKTEEKLISYSCIGKNMSIRRIGQDMPIAIFYLKKHCLQIN